MKIRRGFVSNSSVSSFCIYGVSIEESEIVERLKKNENIKKTKNDGEEYDEEDWDCMYEILYSIISENEELKGLEFHCVEDYYIGVSLKNFKDDETGAQFKKRIEEKVGKLLGGDLEFEIIEMAYHD